MTDTTHMGKIWGWLFILAGIYVGMEVYNNGMDRALGGIFASGSVVNRIEKLGDGDVSSDPANRSRTTVKRRRVTLPQAIGQRVQGHMDGRSDAIEQGSR